MQDILQIYQIYKLDRNIDLYHDFMNAENVGTFYEIVMYAVSFRFKKKNLI